MERPHSDAKKPVKREYSEPTLTEVELRPTEAVLGICRGTGGGSLQSDCTYPVPCSAQGS